MDIKILAQNVRRLRAAKRISQIALAESAGLSLPAIKNIEGAKNIPRINTINALAQALDVKLQVLFRRVRELKNVRFRASKRMQNRENILADASHWLDEFNFLEGILNEQQDFLLEKTAIKCSRSKVIESAQLSRNALGLEDTEPIHDICGLLEHAGIKIYPISSASDGFFGLSIGKEDGGPAILINCWERISIERRIFSTAHELGHLMLHQEAYDVTQTEENREEEQEADIFAGHFLMTDKGFRKEWDDASGLHLVDRIFKVKRIFHVSYKTVLIRLKEYGRVDDSVWMKFNAAYQKRFNRRLSFKEEPMAMRAAEPFGLQSFDFYEDRFSRLVRKAVEEDKISISRGAEILRIGIEEMQDLLHDCQVFV